MIKLSTKSLSLLRECLVRHEPELLPTIEDANTSEYTPEFYNQLRAIVGDELIEKGFNEEWEPNDYGKELENLIDEIGRLFM